MWFENWLVYRPVRADEDWQPPPSPDIQDVELRDAAGRRLHGWWCPCPGGRGAVLYCHGNAGNLSWRGGSVLKMRQLLKAGVLIFDYPGYGKSEGRPGEAGCYAAADAAYDWLVQEQKVPAQEITIYGGSLGGGVAVDLASRKPCRALMLVKTFTSLPDVAQSLNPWLPVRWLMRNRFDNLAKIGQCQQPVFIGHGTADQLVPFAQGEKLFAAANAPKHFFRLDHADHNDSLPAEFFTAFQEFLAEAEALTAVRPK